MQKSSLSIDEVTQYLRTLGLGAVDGDALHQFALKKLANAKEIVSRRTVNHQKGLINGSFGDNRYDKSHGYGALTKADYYLNNSEHMEAVA